MLRANRAVAVILLVAVVLGVVLVIMSLQARRNQIRAENAEHEARERLWKASLAQARAEVLSTQAGHRAAALEAVHSAAAMRPSRELRNEAIAAMSLRDLVKEREWTLQPYAYGFSFDPDLEYYLVRYREKTLSMFRVADNTRVRDFPMPLFAPAGWNIGDFQFSPTGKYVVIRYNGGAIGFWEKETGKMVRVLGPGQQMKNYCWPPTFTADDKTMCLLMTSAGGPLELFDIETGEVRHLPQLPQKCVWTGGFESRLSLSPRGDLLAWFEGSNVHILDGATGALKQTIPAPSLVHSVSWSEQSDRLAFGCDNYTLFVWDVRSNRVQQLGGKVISSSVQRFSPDGKLLITAGNDGMTCLWDMNTARIMSQTNEVRAMFVSRDGTRIAGGVPGKRVSIWRIVEPLQLKTLECTHLPRNSGWQSDLTPDGRWLIWSPPSWTTARGFELFYLEKENRSLFFPATQKTAVGFLPGTRQFWTTGPESLILRNLPEGDLSAGIPKGETVLPLPAGFQPRGASFSADGKYAAVSGPNNVIMISTAGNGKPVTLEKRFNATLDAAGPASPTGSGMLAVSPDGQWVYGGFNVETGGLPIWNGRTGKLVRTFPVSPASGVFSPDGRWLATVSANHCRLWETGSWHLHLMRPRPELLSHAGFAAFSADSSLVAWSHGADSVALTEPGSSKDLCQISFSGLGTITGLRFSADGHRLVATGIEGRMMVADITYLRRELAAMGLDWPLPAAAEAAAVSPAAVESSAWTPALLVIIPVGIAAILGTLVLRRQGRLTGEFVVATDVAAQRERELAAEREVSELKSRFVTTVSHEFRTPLGITMSAIELLRHYEDRLPEEERRQLFDDIHSATRNMAGLMEQVLVLGRVDAGKLAYRPAPLDLDTLARKLADESLSATNRKCPVEWSMENDLSGASADEALLRHIFSNLLSNGVKYSPAGARVNFTGRREGQLAVFTVQDQGIGIPESDLPRLYEAFHRGANVGEIPGTGLGLVIIKRCVDLHLGTIEVYSKPGEGTTFTVRLPAWRE